MCNEAKKLKRLLERKTERARQKKDQAREKGEEVSSDEEGGLKRKILQCASFVYTFRVGA